MSQKRRRDYITAFCAAVTLPAWRRLPHRQPFSLRFVEPEDGKIISTSFVCFYGHTFRITEASLVLCGNSPPPLPVRSASPHHVPIFLHLQRHMKRPGSAVFRRQLHLPCGRGSHWDYVMIGQNNQTQACSLKCCCTVHHYHHNLERPSLAERGESRGP